MSAYQPFKTITRICAAVLTAQVCVTTILAYAAPPRIRLETRVLGQNQWLAGSTASLRVLTSDHLSGSPIAGAPVTISLARKGEDTFYSLYTGRTDFRGTVNASFNVPSDADGDYALRVTSAAMGERDQVDSSIRIKKAVRVLLTTDKPIYQPGQIIHIRALALQLPSLRPVSNQPCTLEVADSRGNKVFKKAVTLSDFGVAGADFQLATEINQGPYTIRAIVGKDEVEKKVTVQRYVLPKFKVTLETGKKYYLPGETVHGTVRAAYFFGKQVDGGTVDVRLSTFDVAFHDFAELSGKTSGSGVFEFQAQLPDTLVGQPLEEGNALVKAEASVTDGAGHTEKATITVPVAKSALTVNVIPEGGQLIPDVDNTLYVVLSYPDGSPASGARFSLMTGTPPGSPETRPAPVKVSDLGIGEAHVRPAGTALQITVNAQDSQGNEAQYSTSLGVRAEEQSILLRPARAVAAVGQDLPLTILCSRSTGYVYLDAVKDGQTVQTRSLSLSRGRAELDLPLTADLAGTLDLHAYLISPTGNIIRDSRTVFVNPASGLHIKITPDRNTYLPGKPARIDFHVTDSHGKGLAAALGVSIVDESVYALQELQPGLEKIYFMLEKELAEPKFEIHGITPKELFTPDGARAGGSELSPEKQQAAQVLFAEVHKQQLQEGKTLFPLNSDSYADKIKKAQDALSKKAREDYATIADGIRRFSQSWSRNGAVNWPDALRQLGGIHYLVREGLLPATILTDAWGTPYEFLPSPWGSYQGGFVVWSYGLDRKKNTVDDIVVRGYPASAGEASDVFFGVSGNAAISRAGMGGFGGVFNGAAQRMVFAAPAAMRPDRVDAIFADGHAALAMAAGEGKGARSTSETAARPDVRVRTFFPETLYFNPQVITDGDGNGHISLDMADSITSWRLSAMGSSADGLLGSSTEALRVFQDFFIDLDLPVALTQNDEVSIPVAVYNYLQGPQKVELEIAKEPWFELESAPTQTLEIGAGDVQAVHYRIRVKEIGWHKLTVKAYGSKMNDAISRDIEVLPDGQRVDEAVNGRLEGDITKTVTIPPSAISGAGNILVKVYPGIFSQVVEGMDALLRMPFGCFEQTSSVTYPNILVLNYMRATKQSTPDIQMKAEQYINIGYQRLLSYECKTGGFEWFGHDPGNLVLTAYGLLEFADMSKVYEVDPAVIDRTQRWLIARQNEDGSWAPDKGGIAEGAINRQTDDFRTTAYVLWALRASGAASGAVDKAMSYLTDHWGKVDDAYALALAANAFLAQPDGKSKCIDMCGKLAGLHRKSDDGIYWTTSGNTAVSSTGKSADVETTALAALALMKTGRYNDIVTGALTYLIKSKDPHGTWGSTQATIFALKALLESLADQTQDVNAQVTVLVNGQEAGTFKLTPENSDVLRQVDCKKLVRVGDNKVEVRFNGKGSSLYQISSYYYQPWEAATRQPGKLMDISVDFDRTRLATDDVVTSTVKVVYNGPGSANMVIVDLGIPPGFQVLPEDLDALVSDGTFQKYSLTGRQVIVYLDRLDSGKALSFHYRMRAKFPIKAKTLKSTVYEYYNPDVRAVSPPAEMVVQ